MKSTRLPTSFTPTPAPLPSAIRAALPPDQAGFGLLETLLTLAAGIGIVAAVGVLYQRTSTSQTVARESSHVAALMENATRVYASRSNFTDLDTNSALAGRVFPADLLDTNGRPVNPWGGDLTITAQVDPADGATAPARGFTIAYSNVPSKACAALAVNAGQGFSLVSVRPSNQGGYTPAGAGMNAVIRPPGPPPVDLYFGSVMSGTQAGQVDPALASQRCANDANTVAFTFFRSSGSLTNAVCSASTPAPSPDAQTQTANCTPGYLLPFAPYDDHWTQNRSRNYVCNASGTWDPGTWSPWLPVNGCVPACAPTSGITAGTFVCPGSRLITDAGPYQYLSSAPNATPWTQTCSTPIGPLGKKVFGSTTPTYTCAPACTSTSSPDIQPAPCPVGTVSTTDGSGFSGTQTRTLTSTCATPVGPLGAPVPGPWGAPVGQSCAPACTPALNTQWVPASAPCPAGQSGSHTWEKQQTQTASCPAPTGPNGPWSPWADTGTTRNDVNTCAPNCVAPPPSTASQTVQCVAPTTGSWTQTQTTMWTCPAPTGAATSSTGPWLPATAPAGACITPPPPCTHPASPPTSQSPACPANPGGWVQTRICTESACPPAGGPTTWSCGAWSNPTAPASCTPTPACTHPASPPTSQSPACPANPGGWVQTRVCTESACPAAGGPTTWSCGAWSNPTAPASCTAPPPPPAIVRSCKLKGPGDVRSETDNGCSVRITSANIPGIVNAKFMVDADPAQYTITWSGDCVGSGVSCTNATMNIGPTRPGRNYEVDWTARNQATGATQSGHISAYYGEG